MSYQLRMQQMYNANMNSEMCSLLQTIIQWCNNAPKQLPYLCIILSLNSSLTRKQSVQYVESNFIPCRNWKKTQPIPEQFVLHIFLSIHSCEKMCCIKTMLFQLWQYVFQVRTELQREETFNTKNCKCCWRTHG